MLLGIAGTVCDENLRATKKIFKGPHGVAPTL